MTGTIPEVRSHGAFAARPARGYRVLFVSRKLPFADGGGNGAYANDLLQWLVARGAGVDCLLLTELDDSTIPPLWSIPQKGMSGIRVINPGAFRVGDRYLHPWRFVRRKPDPARAVRTTAPSVAAERVAVKQAVSRGKYDAILMNYLWLAPACAGHGVTTLALTHDVWSDRAAGAEYIYTADEEAALLNSADHVLAISPYDARRFEQMGVSKPVHVLYKALAAAPPEDSSPPSARCLFVGSGYGPNAEGLAWFLEKVWPLVLTELPSAHLDVCGAVCGSVKEAPLNVHLHGRVADLGEFYHRAAVAIVPLLRGTGLKIKLVEAVSYRKPVVSTSIGVQGIEQLVGHGVDRADAARDFATNVLRHLSDPASAGREGMLARREAERFLSSDIAYAPVWEIMSNSAK